MKKLTAVAVSVLVFIVLGGFALASDQSLGEKLERGIWADIKAKNWDAVENKIAQGFQSAHQDGARDRAHEIKLLRNLNLGEYKLTDFKVTRNGSVIIVTYFGSVEEEIKGKKVPKKPAARLTVWLKTDKGWQWITHANLIPVN